MASRPPIVETLKAQVIEAAPLMTFGAVPGPITVAPSAFLTLPELTGAASSGSYDATRFDIRDIPAIKQVGVFSAIADGLAPSGSSYNSIGFWLSWIALNDNTHVETLARTYFTAQNLNELSEYDLFNIYSSPGVLNLLRLSIANYGANNTALSFEASGEVGWNFDAYSMDAAWGAATFSLWVNCVVAHTFRMQVSP